MKSGYQQKQKAAEAERIGKIEYAKFEAKQLIANILLYEKIRPDKIEIASINYSQIEEGLQIIVFAYEQQFEARYIRLFFKSKEKKYKLVQLTKEEFELERGLYFLD